MDKIIKFMKHFNPEGSVIPVDETDIQVLEDLAGDLPKIYRQFLRTMGKSIAGIEFSSPCFDIEGLIALYGLKPWLRRERFLCIAVDKSETDWYYFIDKSYPIGKGEDCRIVRMPLDSHFVTDAGWQLHVGFEEFLHFELFDELRVNSFSICADYGLRGLEMNAPACSVDAVCALAEVLGFRREPPSENCRMYDRGDAVMLLYRQPEREGFSFAIACETLDEMALLQSRFNEVSGIVPRLRTRTIGENDVKGR